MGGRFSAQWQRCPLLRSPLCQILFTCFPRTSACTHCSQQRRASALGTSLAETVRFQEPPRRAGPGPSERSHAAAFRKQPGLPSRNQIVPCSVCTPGLSDSATRIESSRTRSCLTHPGISSSRSELQDIKPGAALGQILWLYYVIS